jgi:hypothetical protein
MKIYTTESINELIDKYNLAEQVSRYNKIYFQNINGVRKAGIKFAMSQNEIDEYIKCKLSIYYFAEHYCKIKLEDGSIGKIELRDYQKDILKLYTENRYSILMASRQIGKTVLAVITILHMILFNKDKGVMIVANKSETTKEIIRKIKDIYKLLPFFLKVGVINWNERYLQFENGCRVQSQSRTKEPAVSNTIDLLYIDEFAKIPDSIIRPFYYSIIPTISSIENSKIILTSTPNGYNLFYELLSNSELPYDHPDKNAFASKRVYWWQVPGRMDTKIIFNEDKLKYHNCSISGVLSYLRNLGLDIYEKKIDNKITYFIKYDVDNDKTYIGNIREMIIEYTPLKEISRIESWREEQICLIGGEATFRQEFDLQFIQYEKNSYNNRIHNMSQLKKKIRDKLNGV